MINIMHKNQKLSLSALLTSLLFYFSAVLVSAATLSILPKTGELKVNQNFILEIKVNAGDDSFNTAQATVDFPPDLLEVKSIDSSPSGSAFSFWLEEPSFSNSDGKINFIGGTTNGISGSAILILKINFFAKAPGEAFIRLSDAAVTAADGNLPALRFPVNR